MVEREQPLNKACEPCRSLKVRCLPTNDGGISSCQRCIKFNRTCVYAPPHRKKQRKRTDARVTELEKEILAMRNLLDRREPPAPTAPVMHGASMFENGIQPEMDQPQPDIIDRGLISMDDARQLLAHYATIGVRHLPLVHIRPQQTAEELRVTHPLLFKAIMTTAASALRPHLFTQLSTEIIKEYVQRVMLNGEKTLELVQAISITSAWYHPTDKWATLKFYEYITLASTMAMDIGLGDRESVITISDPLLQLERKRTLVACFTHSSVTAFGLRRPNTLPFSSYMEEIVHELTVSPYGQESDRLLAAFASLYRIADEISVTFSLADAGREGRFPDNYLRHHVYSFASKLQAWKDRFRIDTTSVELQYLYHFIVMTLNELPLHLTYPTAWFRPPHFLCCPTVPDRSFNMLASQYLPVACASAQAMINIFNSRPIHSLRVGPNYMYASLLGAVITLSAISLLPHAPEYAVTGPLEFFRDVTQAEKLLDAVIAKAMEAAGRMEYRIPSMFAISLTRLRKWLRWMIEQREQNPNVSDLPAFSLFAGPEDHPCLKNDYLDNFNASRGSSLEGSPGVAMHGSPLSRSDTNSVEPYPPLMHSSPPQTNPAFIPLPRDIFSVNGNYDDADFGWSNAIDQDFSSVLDPSLFEQDLAFLNLGTLGANSLGPNGMGANTAVLNSMHGVQ